MSLRTPFFPSERWQLKTIIGCGTLDSVSRSNNKATKRTQKRNYFVLCYVLFDEGVFTRIHVKSHISHHSIKLANSSYSSYKIQYETLRSVKTKEKVHPWNSRWKHANKIFRCEYKPSIFDERSDFIHTNT